MQQESLKNKTIKGVGWSAVDAIWEQGVTFLNNVWNQLYQVVICRCYAPSSLGHYTRANEYANLFSSNLTSIVQRVSYPVLAEI